MKCRIRGHGRLACRDRCQLAEKLFIGEIAPAKPSPSKIRHQLLIWRGSIASFTTVFLASHNAFLVEALERLNQIMVLLGPTALACQPVFKKSPMNMMRSMTLFNRADAAEAAITSLQCGESPLANYRQPAARQSRLKQNMFTPPATHVDFRHQIARHNIYHRRHRRTISLAFWSASTLSSWQLIWRVVRWCVSATVQNNLACRAGSMPVISGLGTLIGSNFGPDTIPQMHNWATPSWR